MKIASVLRSSCSARELSDRGRPRPSTGTPSTALWAASGHDPGYEPCQRGEYILQNDDRPRRNAGNARRLQVVTHRAQISPRLRVAQKEVSTETDAREQNDGNGNIKEYALTEPGKGTRSIWQVNHIEAEEEVAAEAVNERAHGEGSENRGQLDVGVRPERRRRMWRMRWKSLIVTIAYAALS